MKKLILFLALISFVSCSENERLIYDLEARDVYFNGVTKDNDSVYVSLLTKEDVSTATIPVKILGNTLSTPKKFKVEIVKERTTAVEGKHYKKLPDYYEFPVDVITYDMPIELLKGDEAIKETPVVLAIRLVGSNEMGIAYDNRSFIRIVIADMLAAPTGTGWNGNLTVFNQLFGEYSRAKHLMIIEILGEDLDLSPQALYWNQDYYIPYARKLYNMITNGVYKDENGKVMQGWNVP